ncbi:phytoene desaturase family protein [Actinotalea fermentans]|uniref:Pyridine nucleotide-disulfide oxidoreductase domain-containing protein 2 n=1 Tax=Actinotalea fermentans TaxID=43671 RepID=A0A511YV28_9CELL|nr:NAD(P)/FAD-dependent oxidoreductase [Actinotalea fermentans]GEN79058.1 dehydrogenase [Actinotalea fermentans]
MITRTADAVVIGAGPNGLVAANALADAGWDVLLVEAADEVGGAVRSAEVTAPGFQTDLFSAFYPLAAASPVIAGLDLHRHGLAWSRAPAVLAHVQDDGTGVVLESDAQATAAGLDARAPGDGGAWLDLVAGWQQVRDDVLDALFTPFPPTGALVRLLRHAGTRGALDLARLAVLPVRRLGAERFRGSGGPLLLTGNALHADLPPDAAGSGLFGWLLAMLGQDIGFPVPRGGAGMLARALADRFTAAGGEIALRTRVTAVAVAGNRAVGVVTADGTRVRARRAVLADVVAPTLYRELLGPRHVPARVLADLEAFAWDHPTLKVNWALDGPVPWRAPGAGRAGTVHLGVDLDGFVRVAADLAVGTLPRQPFLLFGQMTTADPARSPHGTQSAWAYTHLPHRRLAAAELREHVGRVEEALERAAPGFAARVIARHVQTPADLEAADANLVGGAVNGGTAALHQQLVFRPTPGLGRPETPVAGLYLASASAHPGGGVHGACGWNAARAALADDGPTGAVRRRLARTAWARLT